MKFICSPVSAIAMDRLDNGYESDEDLLEIVLDDVLYEKIWKSGFFDEINISLNKYIDDYEDEDITNFIELVTLRKINSKYKFIDYFFIKMEKLIDNAINNKTGIFFFF